MILSAIAVNDDIYTKIDNVCCLFISYSTHKIIVYFLKCAPVQCTFGIL